MDTHQNLIKHVKWQLDYSYKTNRECIKCLDMHWFKFTTLSINWKIILVNKNVKTAGKRPNKLYKIICNIICNVYAIYMSIHFSEIWRIQKKNKYKQEVLQNYIENTLTKKLFSETYDLDNNYIEKDILIITANSTVSNGPYHCHFTIFMVWINK